ncbi:DUF2570 family protein [Pasteurella bettyae]|uniref:DUF2570 family protein n=1 Tax=Pasteurella bettyae TaxID=752 RepID=UPI003D29F30D
MITTSIKNSIVLILFGSAVAMGFLFNYYHNKIKKLEQDNQKQQEIIQLQELTNKNLQVDLEMERKAVIEQQAQTEEIMEKAKNATKSVKAVLKTHTCTTNRLPDSVIDKLRK